MLTLAGLIAMAQRGERTQRTMESRQIVAEVSRAAHRRAVGRAVERHEAGGGLRHRVVAGAIVRRTELAEAADRDIDDIGFDRAAMLVADPPLVEGAGTEILHHDVRARGQFEEQRATLGIAQIERQTALVAVDCGVQKADPAALARQKRADPPSDLALDRLDLDDVGAKVREQASAHRTRPTGRRLEHTNTLERSRQVAPCVTIEIRLAHRLILPRSGQAGKAASEVVPLSGHRVRGAAGVSRASSR